MADGRRDFRDAVLAEHPGVVDDPPVAGRGGRDGLALNGPDVRLRRIGQRRTHEPEPEEHAEHGGDDPQVFVAEDAVAVEFVHIHQFQPAVAALAFVFLQHLPAFGQVLFPPELSV